MRDECRTALVVVVVVVVGLGAACSGAPTGTEPNPREAPVGRFAAGGDTERCVYTANRVDQLDAFAASIGEPVACALVFNNAAPTWADLEQPWFTIHSSPDSNWADWKAADPDRRLVITQSLIPDEAPTDWRHLGATGAYDASAGRLAENMVAAGLGDSVIRLAHEANGTWTKDRVGDDPAAYDDWRTYWGRFVGAMDAVPGSDFLFDWTVNAGTRPIPLDAYYPGDDVVDIIGVDVYDFWDEPILGPAPVDPVARWAQRYVEPGGTGSVVAFAKAHDKPLSIPEWGLSAVGHKGGAGDNPMFVDEIAAIVADNDVSYQSYFQATTDVAMLLTDAPRSFAAYQEHFTSRTEETHQP